MGRGGWGRDAAWRGEIYLLGGGDVDFLVGEEVLDGEELEAGVFGVGDGFGLEEVGFGVRAQHVVGLKDS